MAACVAPPTSVTAKMKKRCWTESKYGVLTHVLAKIDLGGFRHDNQCLSVRYFDRTISALSKVSSMKNSGRAPVLMPGVSKAFQYGPNTEQ